MNKEDKKPSINININENLLNKINNLVEKSDDKISQLIERLLIEYIK